MTNNKANALAIREAQIKSWNQSKSKMADVYIDRAMGYSYKKLSEKHDISKSVLNFHFGSNKFCASDEYKAIIWKELKDQGEDADLIFSQLFHYEYDFSTKINDTRNYDDQRRKVLTHHPDARIIYKKSIGPKPMSDTGIKLEYPYNQDWTRGYLVTKLSGREKGRKNVSLINAHTKERSSVSYARYLMSTHIGRYLSAKEHVDHINNDKTDDRIENLQVLDVKRNNRKASKPAAYIKTSCAICGKRFMRRKNLYKFGFVATCSRSCGRVVQSISDEEKKKMIESNENETVYIKITDLEEIYGVKPGSKAAIVLD